MAAAQLAELRKGIDAFGQTVVGTTAELLDGDRTSIRNGETNLANLAADSVLAFANETTNLFEAGSPLAGRPTAVLLNAGVFRASVQPGATTQAQLTEVFPMGNWFVALSTDAQELWVSLPPA